MDSEMVQEMRAVRRNYTRKERVQEVNQIPPQVENTVLRAWCRGERPSAIERATGLTHRQLVLIRCAWAGGW
jgi:hypothetical protein